MMQMKLHHPYYTYAINHLIHQRCNEICLKCHHKELPDEQYKAHPSEVFWALPSSGPILHYEDMKNNERYNLKVICFENIVIFLMAELINTRAQIYSKNNALTSTTEPFLLLFFFFWDPQNCIFTCLNDSIRLQQSSSENISLRCIVLLCVCFIRNLRWG